MQPKPPFRTPSGQGAFYHPPLDTIRVALYARISDRDQHSLDFQLDALREHVERRRWAIASESREVGSGAVRRPMREQVMTEARQRQIDAIAVWKLDRWGRSLPDLITTLDELRELDVAFVSVTESLDFSTAPGRAMAGLLAVFAQFERELLHERIRAGIANARAKGVRFGRPRTALNKAFEVQSMIAQGYTVSSVARALGICRASVRNASKAKVTTLEEERGDAWTLAETPELFAPATP